MKFIAKEVQNSTNMYYIAYQLEDGSERMCTEVGYSEAFPKDRADRIVEALNKAVAEGPVEDPTKLVEDVITQDNESIIDSESKNVVVPKSKESAPTVAPKKTTTKKVKN